MMRKLAAATAEFNAAPHPSPAATNCSSRTCPWWPYTNSNDFKANTALILVILFCALICSVAFNAAVRYVVRVHCCRRRGEDEEDPKPEKEVEVPTVVYAEGMGGESECVICLSDFVVGEKIRVLDKCNHGFHLQCVQRWLVSHSSCPTCRANCAIEMNSSTAGAVVSGSNTVGL